MEKEVLNLILVEVREMKGDMSEVKTRLTNIEGRLANVENDVSEIKVRLTNVEETSRFNKETVQSIMNVVTSHYMEFKKHIRANGVQHNLYNAKILKYNKDN